MLVKSGQPKGTGIVFLHGYGANAADLFPLAEELSWSSKESWYFPDAPLEIPLGPHMVGRAWFQIPLRELQQGVDYSNSTPSGLEKAARHVHALLEKLPHDKLILGGFSQGAMLSTQVVLENPKKFLGLVQLSGTLVHSGIWKKLAVQHPKSYFQSHGTMDPVLPFSGAEKLHQLFQECGWEGQFHSFRGGHEIPSVVLRDLKFYLKNLVSSSS